MIFFLLLKYLGNFVENQMTVYVWPISDFMFCAIVYLNVLISILINSEHLHSATISFCFSSYVFFLTASFTNFLKNAVYYSFSWLWYVCTFVCSAWKILFRLFFGLIKWSWFLLDTLPVLNEAFSKTAIWRQWVLYSFKFCVAWSCVLGERMELSWTWLQPFLNDLSCASSSEIWLNVSNQDSPAQS